ncbi:hypothetical protein BIY23_01680 [Wolbachia pipientis]|uniref:Nudix hydrolase domain-containing protein n=1 Tax=Wolbachia pipientis TaxID=955 RepID=A0A1E7QL80_WOLPI|nr:NUDIX domain-containing protein [Wolbachia pipientis]OEY87167.1 hypothetical protein BIY23_01680 [Wolbachia pipientis]
MSKIYSNIVKYCITAVLSGISGYYYAIQYTKTNDKPILTVAGIVHICPGNKVALIERGKEPKGLAMFGGHVEARESPEHAFMRELQEELNITNVYNIKLVGIHGEFGRDPRQHSVEVTYSCATPQVPRAGSDAKSVAMYSLNEIKEKLQNDPTTFAFDHGKIIKHYLDNLSTCNPCSELSNVSLTNRIFDKHHIHSKSDLTYIK